jgi:predicted nucleic acid-binding protein
VTPSDLSDISGGEGSDQPLLFVDTNVFLRFLTNDVPEQAAAAETLFRRAAAGEVRLTTNCMVLAELVWVLESYYHLARSEVRERVLAVAHMDGLHLLEIDLVTDAVFAYEASRVDFVDAYNACWMREHELHRVVTFDETHFARLDWVDIERIA